MPVLTAIALSAFWTAFSTVGQMIYDNMLKDIMQPASDTLTAWIKDKTGWSDKKTKQDLQDACAKAEKSLMEEFGLIPATRILRGIEKLSGSPDLSQKFVLGILEKNNLKRSEFTHQILTNLPGRLANDQDEVILEKFLLLLNAQLYKNDTYKPLIDFYAQEYGHRMLESLTQDVHSLTATVDAEHQAVRVVLAKVSPEEMEQSRKRYLSQMRATFKEIDFRGFPAIAEQNSNVLLKDLYMPVKIKYDSGGKDFQQEFIRLMKGHSINQEPPSAQDTGPTSDQKPGPVNEAEFSLSIFQSSPWIVVLGDPGSGKTTALKMLIMLNIESPGCQSGEGLPLFVSLRDFGRKRTQNTSYSILRFLYDYAEADLTCICPEGFFEAALEDGSCLVCFDGLDEIADPGERQVISDLVESFVFRYPLNYYAVTSRILGYEYAPLSQLVFPHYIVQPFNDFTIRQYISRWYSIREKSAVQARMVSEDLAKRVLMSDRIHDLAKNPLMLAIICLIHRVYADLPSDRVQLYQKCVEAFLFSRDEFKRLEVSDADKPYFRYREEILTEIAYWMQTEIKSDTGRSVIVDQAEMEAHIAQFLVEEPSIKLSPLEARQQTSRFLEIVPQRSGLLVELGQGKFTFVHLTFQEYFCATYIKQNYSSDPEMLWTLLQPRLFDPSWREVILLTLGLLSSLKIRKLGVNFPTWLARQALDIDLPYGRYFPRKLSLINSFLVENVRLEVALEDELVSRWLEILRAPVCSQQVIDVQEELKKVWQRDQVKHRLAAVAQDAAQPMLLRLNILAMYTSEENLYEEIPWVEDTLIQIARDPSSSPYFRSVALLHFLARGKDLHKAAQVVQNIIEEGDCGVEVCASPLCLLDEKWVKKILNTHPSLPEKKRKKSILSWNIEELDSLVRADARWGAILSTAGKTEIWTCLLESLEGQYQQPDYIEKLFIGDHIHIGTNNYKLPNLKKIPNLNLGGLSSNNMTAPQELRTRLTRDLLTIARAYSSAWIKGYALQLIKLPGVGNETQDQILTEAIDVGDSFVVTTKYFTRFIELRREALKVNQIAEEKDDCDWLLSWSDRLFQSHHFLLKSDYSNALSFVNDPDTNARILDTLSRVFNSDTYPVSSRLLAGNAMQDLSPEKIVLPLQTLELFLENADNAYIKARIVDIMVRQRFLSGEEGSQKLLACAQDEYLMIRQDEILNKLAKSEIDLCPIFQHIMEKPLALPGDEVIKNRVYWMFKSRVLPPMNEERALMLIEDN